MGAIVLPIEEQQLHWRRLAEKTLKLTPPANWSGAERMALAGDINGFRAD